MSILINIPNRPIGKFIDLLQQRIPEEEIEVWPDVKKPDDVIMALVWKHQAGSLSSFPNLKALHSFGAGVDSILADHSLPELPLARLVDDKLAQDMAQYVSAMVQQHRLRLAQFRQQQTVGNWKPKGPVKHNKVGILGLGELGRSVANLLTIQGFNVLGWSRTEKQLAGVKCYSGEQGLSQMLPQSDYLVCLLPLTTSTENILSRELFEQLPNHAVLINVARGQHLNEQDLLDAFEQGQLDSAILDVFRQEPLPPEHSFWSHPKITITPHISAVTDIKATVDQIADNYYRVKQGQDMLNTVDLQRGY